MIDQFIILDMSNDHQIGNSINSILSHPCLPLIISAHDDGNIRISDIKSGKIIHTMTGHLDAISSVSIDSNGLQLLSGSKYRFDMIINFFL